MQASASWLYVVRRVVIARACQNLCHTLLVKKAILEELHVARLARVRHVFDVHAAIPLVRELSDPIVQLLLVLALERRQVTVVRPVAAHPAKPGVAISGGSLEPGGDLVHGKQLLQAFSNQRMLALRGCCQAGRGRTSGAFAAFGCSASGCKLCVAGRSCAQKS